MEEILGRILGIEAEAKAILSEAHELASLLQQQAGEEAEERLAQAREGAEDEARALRQQAHQEAEEERARILARAEQVPQQADGMDHYEAAVEYVTAMISARGLGKSEG